MKKLFENWRVFTEGTVKPQDLEDAWNVFKDWLMNQNIFRVLGNIENVKTYFSTSKQIETVPINRIKIFQDWGRRVDSKFVENPVILLELPTNIYLPLDGQHRVLTKKDKGENNIQALVITLPWKAGMKKQGRQTYILDIE